MNTATFLPQIQEYLDEQIPLIEESVNINLLRSDGVILYSSHKNRVENSSIGALSAGLWQAAISLMGMLGENQSEDFKLNFSTSAQGVLIYPVCIQGDELYLTAIYKDLVNPGPLRQKIQTLTGKLRHLQFEKKIKNNQITTKKNNKRSEYLFDDISDQEIDSLFMV